MKGDEVVAQQHGKQVISLVVSCLLFFGIAAPLSAEVAFSTAFRFDMAVDDATPDTRGNEFTVPFGISYKI